MNMFTFNKSVIIGIVSFMSIELDGQTYKISGKLVDSSGIGLEAASVILLETADSTMIGFSVTDKQGKFSLDHSATGNYLIQFSYTGYESQWKNIIIVKEKATYDLGLIKLHVRDYLLPEMVVKAEHNPIKFGKDTVEYNANAFKIQPGDVVEDLIKKLPGLEVERDGTVKAYGEKVENVLVDGKEFFGKDTRIATKNLEADAVDKVQVFDKKSDAAAFTGVDDGRDEKTINLQLKENKKQGYFGNASAGAGTDERYSAKANLNRFTSGSRFSFIGNANNINEQSFSIDDYINFMGGIGAFMSGGSGRVRIELNDNSGIPMMGNGQLSGVQNSQAFGLNYSKDLSVKTEMTGSLFYSRLSNRLSEYVLRQSIGNTSNYNTTEENEQYSKNQNRNLNFYLKQKIDSSQQLTFRLNGGMSDSDFENEAHSATFQPASLRVNESYSINKLKADNYNLNSSLAWMKKLGRPGRSMVSRINGRMQNNARTGNLFSENFFYILSTEPDSIHQRQDLKDQSLNYEASFAYTEPFGRKKYLELNAMHSNYRHETENDYFDITGSGNEQRNILLSKSYNSDYTISNAGANVLLNTKKLHLTAGFKFQHSTLTGSLKSTQENSVRKSYDKFLPAVFGEYQFGNARHINFEYQTSLQEPGIEQLQPVVNNSDPLNIYTGNPELNPEYRHELRANYFLYDQFNFTSLFVNLNGAYVHDRITDIVEIDSAFRRTIHPVNVPFEKSIRAGIDFSTPIRPLRINTRIRLGSGVSDGILYVNDEKNQVMRWRNNLNFSVENRNKDVVDATIGWKISHNKTNYSVNKVNNQQYNEQAFYTEFVYSSLKKLTIKSSFEYRMYTSSLFREKITIPLWELSASCFFLKDNKLKLQLKIFDLLNENKGIRRTSQLNYSEEQRSNVLGRYAMLQLAYAIRGFSARKNGFEIKVEN
jgi:hypothetical protein